MNLDLESVNIVVAFWAAVATIWGVWGQWRGVKLQERLAQLEESRELVRLASTKRAELVPENVHTIHNGKPRRALRITNRGLAEARDIQIVVDGTPLAPRHRISPWTEQIVSKLGSTMKADYLLSDSFLQYEEKFSVRLVWNDDSGESQAFETELSTR